MSNRDLSPYRGQFNQVGTPVKRGCLAVFVSGVACGQEVFVSGKTGAGRWLVTFVSSRAHYFSVAEHRLLNIEAKS